MLVPCLNQLTVGYYPALLSQFYALRFGFFLRDINEPEDSVPVAVHSDHADHGERLPGVNYRLGSGKPANSSAPRRAALELASLAVFLALGVLTLIKNSVKAEFHGSASHIAFLKRVTLRRFLLMSSAVRQSVVPV